MSLRNRLPRVKSGGEEVSSPLETSFGSADFEVSSPTYQVTSPLSDDRDPHDYSNGSMGGYSNIVKDSPSQNKKHLPVRHLKYDKNHTGHDGSHQPSSPMSALPRKSPRKGKSSLVLIVSVLLNVFLVIAAIYFNSLSSRSEIKIKHLESLSEKNGHTISTLTGTRDKLEKELHDRELEAKNTRLLQEKVGHFTEENAHLQDIVSTLHQQVNVLDNEKNHLHTELESHAKLGMDLEIKKQAYAEKIHHLQQKIQRESRREALERFGPGPHLVAMEIGLPRDAEKDAHLSEGMHPTFQIELFSLDLMPHTVHLFLEQVEHKLWDGCYFNLNPEHIVQTSVYNLNNPDASALERMNKFKKASLDKVSFQEYSEDLPHLQWTVGFAGRPGGPDFYINKSDNSHIHGPGGQEHHHLNEEADPCFGKVVRGFDVIQRLIEQPIRRDASGVIFEKPIELISAKILKK